MKPLVILFSLMCVVAGAAHAETLRTGVVDDQIWIENAEPGMELHLRILTPAGEVIEGVEPAQGLVTLDVNSYLPDLADGNYNYEVWMQAPAELLVTRGSEADFSLPAEAFGGISPARKTRVNGHFDVVNGYLVDHQMED